MLDSISKDQVSRYLSLVDISLINLKKNDLFKTVIPSKIFENAAMEIPILIGVDGEARSIIEKYNAGLFFEPENEISFFKKLEEIANPERQKEFKKGCRNLAIDFDRKKLANTMYEHIKNTVSQ
jgi:glycosyltransferase involved in cell wall biosynthesis